MTAIYNVTFWSICNFDSIFWIASYFLLRGIASGQMSGFASCLLALPWLDAAHKDKILIFSLELGRVSTDYSTDFVFYWFYC